MNQTQEKMEFVGYLESEIAFHHLLEGQQEEKVQHHHLHTILLLHIMLQ